MGTSYTTYVYYGAPFTVPEPEDEFDPEIDDDPDWDDLIAVIGGWTDRGDYEQRHRAFRSVGVNVDWSGYLEWPDKEQWLYIVESERHEDGRSIPLSDIIAGAAKPDWESRIRDIAEKLGIRLVGQIGWYATMSAG